MRASIGCATALLLLSLPAAATSLELEAAPGIAIGDDQLAGKGFALTGRLGVQTDWVTPSLAVFFAPFGADRISHSRQDGAFEAWAVLAELRFHNPGANQFSAGVGLGVGRLVTTQLENGDFERFQGTEAPYVELVAGYRHQGDSYRIGVDATLHFFNRVDFYSDVSPGHRGQLLAFGLTVTLGCKLLDF